MLPNHHIALILLVTLFLLANCGGDNEDDVDPGSIVEAVTPSGSENYLTGESDYIFDQSRLHTFELTIPQASLDKIDADPSAEQYVAASLTFEGETISPIGVRYKGSIGAFVNCLSGTDWSNPSGFKTCTKLSMKVKINWEGREDRFFGLRKLQFHSQNLDPTQMRERLGYWLFREMNVPAPRSVHARLIINGQYNGIYALTEQIDGRFTRHHFEDGTGNLYKEIWPLSSTGVAHSEQEYLAHLKTNEDENPTADIMRSFALAIESSDSENIQDVISDNMNVDEIIAMAAVDRTIRNDDGPFHWYCDESGGCSNHNFYWYENPTQGTVHLIPWDLDNAFENIARNVNPVTPIADDWGETSAGCGVFRYGLFQLFQRSAACDKLTAGWALYEELYMSKLESLKTGPFSEVETNAVLNQWEQQIRDATMEAAELHGDALTISQWESALSGLKSDLNFARNN